MSLDPTTDVRGVSGDTGRLFGVYTAIVTDNVDPSGLGRVKVRLPWSPDRDRGDYETWARLATLMAGPNRGSWFIPDIDDEVLLAFEGVTRAIHTSSGRCGMAETALRRG